MPDRTAHADIRRSSRSWNGAHPGNIAKTLAGDPVGRRRRSRRRQVSRRGCDPAHLPREGVCLRTVPRPNTPPRRPPTTSSLRYRQPQRVRPATALTQRRTRRHGEKRLPYRARHDLEHDRLTRLSYGAGCRDRLSHRAAAGEREAIITYNGRPVQVLVLREADETHDGQGGWFLWSVGDQSGRRPSATQLDGLAVRAGDLIGRSLPRATPGGSRLLTCRFPSCSDPRWAGCARASRPTARTGSVLFRRAGSPVRHG